MFTISTLNAPKYLLYFLIPLIAVKLHFSNGMNNCAKAIVNRLTKRNVRLSLASPQTPLINTHIACADPENYVGVLLDHEGDVETRA